MRFGSSIVFGPTICSSKIHFHGDMISLRSFNVHCAMYIKHEFTFSFFSCPFTLVSFLIMMMHFRGVKRIDGVHTFASHHIAIHNLVAGLRYL